MTIYTLYVKTHRKTGLKYLGQTSQDPFKYPGSGVDWTVHLKKFGYDVDTEILLQSTDKSERNQIGRYYSTLWHIVTAADDFGNKLWANRIPETGGGSGESRKGIPTGRKGIPTGKCPSRSIALKNKPKSDEHKKSLSLAKKGKPRLGNNFKGPKGKTWTQSNPSKKMLCPHCGKSVNPGNYKNWHGDRCKFKKN